MPEFKVSEDLLKYSKELLRVQITVIGDCPRCGGNDYRKGVCEDCKYVSPELQEAINNWMQSQGLSPEQVSRMQKEKNEARQSLGLPPLAASVIDAFPQLTAAQKKERDPDECPQCKRRGFDLQCVGCGYEEPPPALNHKTPTFTGVSPELLKTRRINFLPSSDVHHKIKKRKKTVRKKQKHKKASQEPNLDNVTTVNTQPIVEIDNAVRQLALSDFYDSTVGDQSKN